MATTKAAFAANGASKAATTTTAVTVANKATASAEDVFEKSDTIDSTGSYDAVGVTRGSDASVASVAYAASLAPHTATDAASHSAVDIESLEWHSMDEIGERAVH